MLVLLVLSSSTRYASPVAATSPLSPPNLGSASIFGILAAGAVSNTGASDIIGSLGVDPSTAVTGFPPGVVTGTMHKDDSAALQAKDDLAGAYSALASDSCARNLTGQNLGGQTLTPGVYCYSSAASLSGTLTLNLEGDVSALYVFQIAGSLTTSGGSAVVVTGGSACNIFWQVGGAAVLGAQTAFSGSILSVGSIMMGNGANITGSAMTQDGSVTLHTNLVGGCAAWRTTVHNTIPGPGCFQVTYPSTVWTSMTCEAPPSSPIPLQVGGSSNYPDDVAESNYYGISSSIGSFYSESNFASETDTGTGGSNQYSLQLNTNTFPCNTPATYYHNADCWQQFVVENCPSSSCGAEGYSVFIQYWLIGYYGTYGYCPPPYLVSWHIFGTSCYTDSTLTSTPNVSAANLGSVSITGGTVVGGSYDDNVQFCYSSTCYSSTLPGTVLNLYQSWYQAEFNVFGVTSSQAVFVPTTGNTFSVYDDIVLSSTSGTISPFCNPTTYTGESNNMYLGSCSTGGNYIQFYEHT
ncbi:MAG TPA: ice-binding family protein [Acidimicrobiales bacterium]|nr:ice-binding family protein [Acidimicrobiales bacterium]